MRINKAYPSVIAIKLLKIESDAYSFPTFFLESLVAWGRHSVLVKSLDTLHGSVFSLSPCFITALYFVLPVPKVSLTAKMRPAPEFEQKKKILTKSSNGLRISLIFDIIMIGYQGSIGTGAEVLLWKLCVGKY